MMLADMGAEVIKIETPGSGDPLRQQGVIRDGLSWYFAAFNRNKRSLTLDLRSDETVGASLNNGLISLLAFLAANYFASGEAPPRTGNDHAIVAPYGMFRTSDGEVALAPSQEQSYQRLVDAIEAAELREDPRFR